jgi:hypothetical protein
MVAAEPHFRYCGKPLIFGNMRRIKVAVVIKNRLLRRPVMVERLCPYLELLEQKTL